MKLGKPWVYGGCIASHGQTMTILPGETPCLRCVFEAAPAPGEAGTCETAGVLGPIVNIIASFQATEALKILTGHRDRVNRELLYFDVWDNVSGASRWRRCWARWTAPAVSGAASSGWRASRDRIRPVCAAATPCRWPSAWRPA